MWSKVNRKWYSEWNILLKNQDGDIIYQYDLNLEGKKVYISIESSSLGDTLAWMSYVEEFRVIRNCEVVVSTFMNHLFVDQYPNLKFVEPGHVVNGIISQYRIGWFYDSNDDIDYSKNPNNFRNQPLQKTASDILGLDYREIRPLLKIPNVKKLKKVGIALHSTAQSKYWNNPTGWQDVVNYLSELGYQVVLYSKENDGYMGNFHPKGVDKFSAGDINTLINDMSTCEFFIGLGSGLSWLSWSLNLPTILISGFSEEWAETKDNTYRVINKSVCHGCFNKYKLDPGDWNWCPVYKGTPHQFECTKSITSDMVIEQIRKIISPEF